MENHIGKICPFCKTEITETDEVTVCPACGIPHHAGCWNENHGCTTFGCSQQNYEPQHTNPTEVCAACGTPLGDGQAFCPKCGTAKAVAPKKNFCGNCGAELQPEQSFCPKCGHKADAVVDNTASSAIEQFNAGVTQKKKKSKALPAIIAAVLVVAVGVGVFVSKTVSAKKAEEAKKEYLQNVEEFLELSLTAGSNLEDIADTIQDYWYDNIWNDMWGDDINDAIVYAMIAKSDEIDQAEVYDSQMEDLYNKIKKVPDDVADEDEDDLKDICDAVKDLYSVYSDFYVLATDPSGSYNTYSTSNSDTTDEFISCYRALEKLMD